MKKKIFAIALAALLFALSIAGASVAYFTDVESATNVFTAGDVDISLTYAGFGTNLDDSADVINVDNEKVYPGQNFVVNATINNVGTEDAYVGAIITLTGVSELVDSTTVKVIDEVGENDNIPVSVRKFLVGLVDTGYSVKMATAGDVITVYVIKTDKLLGTDTNETSGDTNACIFTDVKVPTEWDNAEMKIFSGFKLDVKAYATQTGGFNDAVTAISTAFATDWAGYADANER